MPQSVYKSSKQPVVLKTKKADDFAFKSLLTGPISELSVLRKSLLFAEISMASYLPIKQCNIAAGQMGFTDGKVFDCRHTKAIWFQNQFDSVVVLRGPEVHCWKEIAFHKKMPMTSAETVGKVHKGLKARVDGIWPRLESDLARNNVPLWFCGHSLGGALATICASRCMLSYVKTEPKGIYTFGSPRVGCGRYVNYVSLPHYRWVNNQDVVTRVPLARLGFRHSGVEMHIDRFGRLKDTQGWRRISGWNPTAFSEFRRIETEPLSDHSSTDYVDAIFKITRFEENRAKSQYAKPGVMTGPQDAARPETPSEKTLDCEIKQQRSA